MPHGHNPATLKNGCGSGVRGSRLERMGSPDTEEEQQKVLTLCHPEARWCCLAVCRRRLCSCSPTLRLGHWVGLGTDHTRSSGRKQVWTPEPGEKYAFLSQAEDKNSCLSPEPIHVIIA